MSQEIDGMLDDLINKMLHPDNSVLRSEIKLRIDELKGFDRVIATRIIEERCHARGIKIVHDIAADGRTVMTADELAGDQTLDFRTPAFDPASFSDSGPPATS